MNRLLLVSLALSLVLLVGAPAALAGPSKSKGVVLDCTSKKLKYSTRYFCYMKNPTKKRRKCTGQRLAGTGQMPLLQEQLGLVQCPKRAPPFGHGLTIGVQFGCRPL